MGAMEHTEELVVHLRSSHEEALRAEIEVVWGKREGGSEMMSKKVVIESAV